MQKLRNIILFANAVFYVFTDVFGAKLQNTPNLICILLNNNSIYCYIPRSSKHTDTCKWLGRGILQSLRSSGSDINYMYNLLIMHILPAETKFMLPSMQKLWSWGNFPRTFRTTCLAKLVSDSQELVFHRVETLYNKVASVRWDNTGIRSGQGFLNTSRKH